MKKIAVLIMFVHNLLLASTNGTREKIAFNFPTTKSGSFHEGVTLELWCRQDTTDNIEIRSPTELIVEKSNLVNMAHRYNFLTTNSTAYVLTIERLSRNDQGVYTCRGGQKTKFAQVFVHYSPSDDSPLCTSNYDSPVIFDDLRQDYINFTCTTEEGNPPVLMKLNIFKSNSAMNITDIANVCSYNQQFNNSRSFSCVFNESLENTTFLCDVTQLLPSPYEYQDSCSFGPLRFISNFSISISPASISVHEGEDITLICTTNVTGVEMKWINIIPQDWKYEVTNSKNSSHLEIYNIKQQLTPEITVQCIGTYGNRIIKDSVKITIEGKTNVKLVLFVFLAMFCIILSLSGYHAWKRRNNASCTSKPSLDTQGSQRNEVNTVEMNAIRITSNKNNANNVAIELCDGDERSNSDLLGDQLEVEEVSDMFVNPAYESVSHAADTKVLERKEDQYSEISKQDSQVI